jgi:hypothetical protein
MYQVNEANFTGPIYPIVFLHKSQSSIEQGDIGESVSDLGTFPLLFLPTYRSTNTARETK